jgi:hypothetical protein
MKHTFLQPSTIIQFNESISTIMLECHTKKSGMPSSITHRSSPRKNRRLQHTGWQMIRKLMWPKASVRHRWNSIASQDMTRTRGALCLAALWCRGQTERNPGTNDAPTYIRPVQHCTCQFPLVVSDFMSVCLLGLRSEKIYPNREKWMPVDVEPMYQVP